MRLRLRRRGPAVLAITVALLSGCVGGPDERAEAPAIRTGGDPGSGRDAIVEHGCGSCHRIPGIPNAHALVGPPLDDWSQRSFIAGTLPNDQANLSTWIRDPQQVRPGTAMPTLDLDDDEIADIVAYLFTLR